MTTPAVTLRSSPVIRGRAVGREVHAGRGHLFRPHHAAQRRQAGHLGPHRLLGDPADGGLQADHLLHPRPGDEAGADRVDPDVVRPEFGGERPDQPDDAHLRRGVGRAAVQRALAGHGRDRDQAAGPALDHGRDERPEGEEHAVEVDGEGFPPVLQRDLVQWRRGPGHPGVGDHRAHRADPLRPGGQGRDRGLVADVAGDRDGRPAGLLGLRHRVRQARQVAGAGGDREAGRGEGHRDGPADPPVGAGDHRDRDRPARPLRRYGASGGLTRPCHPRGPPPAAPTGSARGSSAAR